MRAARIAGTGSYVPGPPITNADLAALIGPLAEEVLAGIQVEQRHWIVEPTTGQYRESNSGMAIAAARAALEDAGWTAADVDLVIVATASPDYFLPTVAQLVQDGLQINRCATYELRSGAAGAVQALELGRLLLESGQHRRALVIGSEAISALFVPYLRPLDPDRLRMRERLILYEFGDGAGAILLEASPEEQGSFLGYASACIGGGKSPGILVGGGTRGRYNLDTGELTRHELKIDVVEIGRFSSALIDDAFEAVVAATGIDFRQLDVLVLPEGNAGYLTDDMRASALGRRLEGERPRIVENLRSVGATGSASVPLALDEAARHGSIRAGQKVLLAAVDTSKWLYACAVLEWPALG